MEALTRFFIKRPVVSTVLSLLILILGIRSWFTIPLQEFPSLSNTIITVTTAYPGANAKLVQGFITTPLEKAIASSDGVDYITSTSQDGLSTIQVFVKLNENPQDAFTNVMSKVSQVSSLPKDALKPEILKETGSSIDMMYIGFNSQQMTPQQITDYLTRVIQPKIETIAGVSSADILGGATYAMRIWLDPVRMAAQNVTTADVSAALLRNNILSGGGETKGNWITYPVSANTGISTVDDFKQLVVRHVGNHFIRIKDVANVQLGSENYSSSVFLNGKKAVFVGITPVPSANPLTVIHDVKTMLPELQHSFPPSLSAKVVYDATDYIRASLHEVVRTILEATLIVVLVVFVFLGSWRNVFIPIITIPLSLIGVMTVMLLLNYSLNLLTLLAMVLAIGMVVDDAIIVVENIHRYIEMGRPVLQSAIEGVKEIAVPVVSMSITLAAVYTPIALMGGLTGALFREFALTLAGTVIISGIIALTLSPMLCSKMMRSGQSEGRLMKRINLFFQNLTHKYRSSLSDVMEDRKAYLVMGLVILLSCGFLFMGIFQELAPQEDQSMLYLPISAPQYANLSYLEHFSDRLSHTLNALPQTQDYMVINGAGGENTGIALDVLKPWGQRSASQKQVQTTLSKQVNDIPGIQAPVVGPPPLPTGSGKGSLPFEFYLTTTMPYTYLYPYAQKLTVAAQSSGLFLFAMNSLSIDKPQVLYTIDRNRAALLGLSMQDIGNAIGSALSGGYINQFALDGLNYKVIPQLSRSFRLTSGQVEQIYVRSESGKLVPLSAVLKQSRTVVPNQLAHFQQLNSAAIEGVLMPGHTQGEALSMMKTAAAKILPRDVNFDYGGQLREFVKAGYSLQLTFLFSLLIIYLVLSAQFESFTDPLIVLVTVPMSICGALIPLYCGLATLNIYTEIGLVTLIGLISKHGILMVDFANHLQQSQAITVKEAIIQAASIRLRPILMTTAAMVFGVVPLLMAHGAGAHSRFDIGLVIASGMSVGTLFTLFILPVIYTFLAKKK